MSVHLTWSWRCLGTGRTPCDVTGAGPKFNADAERHLKATGHGIVLRGVPHG